MLCIIVRLPWWLSSKDSGLQCRRPGLDSWLGTLGWEDPWKRAWQPTLVLLPRGF